MSSEDYGDSDYADESMGDYGSDGSDQGYGSDGDFAYSDDDGAGMGSPLAKGVRVSLTGRQGRRDRLGRPARCRRRQAAGHSPRTRRPPPSGASWRHAHFGNVPQLQMLLSAEDICCHGQGRAAGAAQSGGGAGEPPLAFGWRSKLELGGEFWRQPPTFIA